MTLGDLLRKAKDISIQFNSSDIPLMHGDQECEFDFEIHPPEHAGDSWKIKIMNYREGKHDGKTDK